jgi:hypothetical protein
MNISVYDNNHHHNHHHQQASIGTAGTPVMTPTALYADVLLASLQLLGLPQQQQ